MFHNTRYVDLNRAEKYFCILKIKIDETIQPMTLNFSSLMRILLTKFTRFLNNFSTKRH